MQHRYKVARRRLGSSDIRPSNASITDSVTETGDRSEVTKVVPERVKSLADLVRVCEIDLTEWDVERYVCNKWEMGATEKPRRGIKNAVVKELFQVKAWLRRKVALIAARDEVKALLADAKTKVPPRPAVKRLEPGPHLLEIAIPDLHVGKLAWAPETGQGNYDTKIAQRIFRDALEALIARTASFRFERVVLVVGNDLLHADTKAGTTTGGTPLDTDSRFQKSYLVARRLMTEAIDRLRAIAPVTVVVIPGNHDALSTWCLGDSLECYYHKTPDVTVENSPSPRKYVHFGQVMLLFTHGDKGKRENYPLLMATEKPEMFGATKHREAHTGHLHQVRVQEHMGVKVRISPALCPPDAWHSEMHLVGNARAAEAFVWSKTDGLVSLATYTVPQPRDGRAA